MYKFNLEIEIPDKDYCNGCKLRIHANCNNGYYLPNRIEIKGMRMQPRPDICKANDKGASNDI